MTTRRIRSVPARSSDPVRLNWRASSVNRRAYAPDLTAVARTTQEPATTTDPDRTIVPTTLATGSASPVSNDSSTSNPICSTTTPSTGS